ncbi:hypothetical protein AB0D97_12175 [Streptomyces roseus]|uniref:hypothetical protein n=1 Tax=Streptomyces roseus TaxID=66430 RepID=UPI00340F0E13
MTHRIICSCDPGVLDAESTEDPPVVRAPCHGLIVRARAGWERFVGSIEEPEDD